MYKDATDFIPQNLRFTPRTVLKKPPDESLGVFMCARGAVYSGAFLGGGAQAVAGWARGAVCSGRISIQK